jgi:hypothetical protein
MSQCVVRDDDNDNNLYFVKYLPYQKMFQTEVLQFKYFPVFYLRFYLRNNIDVRFICCKHVSQAYPQNCSFLIPLHIYYSEVYITQKQWVLKGERFPLLLLV